MVNRIPLPSSRPSKQKNERLLLPVILSALASLSFILYFHVQHDRSIYHAISAELGHTERTFDEPEIGNKAVLKMEEKLSAVGNAGEPLPIRNETGDVSCFPSNTEQWLDVGSKRLGNMNDSSIIGSYDLVSKSILNINNLLLESNTHSLNLLQQTLCHSKSKLLALDAIERDSYKNPSERDIKTWAFRLIYMATHIHQHLPALAEARDRLKHSQDCKSEMESKQIGRFDFECPNAKLLVVSLGKLGLGAVIRLGAVNALIAGIASNRTVLFVNNADNGAKTIREPWPLSSCKRMDMQCFFMPATPCTVTEGELRNAKLLQRGDMRKLFRTGELDSDLEKQRVLVMNQVLRPQRTPPLLRQNIKRIIDEQIILPLQVQRPNDPLLEVLSKAANRTLDDVVVDEKQYSYYGKSSNINHALVFYMLRPNPYYAKRLEKILNETLQPGFDPNMAMGLPIRASDKCNTESECLKFEQYMTLMDRTWEDRKSLFLGSPTGSNGQNVFQLEKPKSTILVTSESPQVHDEQELFLKESVENNRSFPFQLVNNNFDLHQGTGDPASMDSSGKNVSLEDIMLSSISSLQLQLRARYTVGNCCSNFHLLLFDFLEEGCGPVRDHHPECLQDRFTQRIDGKKWWSFRGFNIHETSHHSKFETQSRLQSTAEADETKIQTDSSSPTSFPARLVQALDLGPVIHLVALHTASKRGYDAMLSLVNDENNPLQVNSLNQVSTGTSARQKRASTLGFSRNSRLRRNGKNKASSFVSIAQSATEAREAYESVEQATLALDDNDYNLIVPPLYAQDSGPMDTSKPTTDDNEWLDLDPESWTLESIIQAEQVIGTLVKVRDWACLSQYETWMPSVAAIGRSIDPEHGLDVILQDILDVVKIKRARTALDPKGKRSYAFQLNEDRFPLLGILKQKERQLLGRGGKDFDKAVVDVRSEIEIKESQIRVGLAQSILFGAAIVDDGLDKVATLDIIFAKAAFGKANQGVMPKISDTGGISVSGFVHPLLAASNCAQSRDEAVPIDLELMYGDEKRALILSGPNGGGKSQSLKSFGVACIMVKLGIPLPVEDASKKPRVDYFHNVMANIGDQQDILEGESTWTGTLNSCARIIETLASGPQNCLSLVLLDEFGTGTDPESGGVIAQAIMEHMLSYSSSRIVATTHSPRLKTISYNSDQIQCATVLLKHGVELNGYKLPSFELQYGVIGDSYALGAVSRSNPRLPDTVISRASQLFTEINAGTAHDYHRSDYIQALTLSMETQLEKAANETLAMKQNMKDSRKCRSAMLSLAASYELHLSRLEGRLQNVYQQLQKEGKDNLDLVGETLSELRVVQREVLGQRELLKERGLKILPISHELQSGESVVIFGEGDFDDMSVTVIADSAMDPSLAPNEVLVSQSCFFGFEMFDDGEQESQFVVQRHELALWDYDALEGDDTSKKWIASTAESERNLASVFASLKTTPKQGPKQSNTETTTSKVFSSRERKAAKKKTKGSKKGKAKK
ncbi:unnamed protein product [Cylindrotheca closterium]|uniref:DNA mismatch repair proteins mutS family domain-containing protein n=1 Tax=Cylindrotheca closterium TaxID=2856 RepID=A0AAD2GCA2_9STRA|nr:unnamed protein product [Cylindrotheca closterium]